MRFLVGLGLLERGDLRLGQQDAVLRRPGFERLEAVPDRSQVVSLPDAAHAGRRDRQWPLSVPWVTKRPVGEDAPQRLAVTDKLRSRAAAFRALRLTCRHVRPNNRAENSYQAEAVGKCPGATLNAAGLVRR